MFLVLPCSCRGPIHWSRLLSQEWRCSWSSADRQCSNYIWVINNFVAYYGVSNIRGLMVISLKMILANGFSPFGHQALAWTINEFFNQLGPSEQISVNSESILVQENNTFSITEVPGTKILKWALVLWFYPVGNEMCFDIRYFNWGL